MNCPNNERVSAHDREFKREKGNSTRRRVRARTFTLSESGRSTIVDTGCSERARVNTNRQNREVGNKKKKEEKKGCNIGKRRVRTLPRPLNKAKLHWQEKEREKKEEKKKDSSGHLRCARISEARTERRKKAKEKKKSLYNFDKHECKNKFQK